LHANYYTLMHSSKHLSSIVSNNHLISISNSICRWVNKNNELWGGWIRTKVKHSIAHNYIHNCCTSSATDGLDAFSAANDAIGIGAGTRSTATDESISQTSPVLLPILWLSN
jgi:hypothetical protein